MENKIDIDEILNEIEDLNEDKMYSMLKDKSLEINEHVTNVENKLKISRLNFIFLVISLFLPIQSWVLILFIVVTVLSFMSAAISYQNRNECLRDYNFMLVRFRDKGILTNENSNMIKNIHIKYLWFE